MHYLSHFLLHRESHCHGIPAKQKEAKPNLKIVGDHFPPSPKVMIGQRL